MHDTIWSPYYGPYDMVHHDGGLCSTMVDGHTLEPLTGVVSTLCYLYMCVHVKVCVYAYLCARALIGLVSFAKEIDGKSEKKENKRNTA